MKTALEGYVGIDTLTEQIRKKALRQGFEFNVMVVGKLKVIVIIFHHYFIDKTVVVLALSTVL